MLRLASGKEAVVMTNAMCASLMHTTSAQAPCAASSCTDMHAILGIIILAASPDGAFPSFFAGVLIRPPI